MKRATKISAFLLALIMMLGIIPVSALAADANEKTSVTDSTGWTKISTAAEFLAMSATGKYYLANDIDFGGRSFNNYLVADFSGTLDGRGYALFNYTVSGVGAGDTAELSVGTFGTLNKTTGTTIIQDLSIGKANAPVVMSASGSCGTLLMGGLAAQGTSGVDNQLILTNVDVYITATTSVTNSTSTAYAMKVGGMIGSGYNNVFTDCTANGTVTDTYNKGRFYKYFGGFIGIPDGGQDSRGDIVYTGCVNNIDLTVGRSDISGGSVGGFFGRSNQPMIVSECTNAGDLTSTNTQCIAGFVGHPSDNVGTRVIFSSCASNGTYTDVDDTNVNYDAYVGDFMASDSWNFWNIDTGFASDRYYYLTNCTVKGEKYATSSNANIISITSKEDLLALSDTSDTTVWTAEKLTEASEAIYRLENDIDMDGATITGHVIDLYFRGIFDGNGYSVTNFSFVGAKADQAGFFKSIGLVTASPADTSTANSKKGYVFNLTLGSADAPIVMTDSIKTNEAGANFGTLAAQAGRYWDAQNAGKAWAYVCGVDVYSDINVNGSGAIHNSRFGGVVGDTGRVIYADTDSYGDLEVKRSKVSGNAWLVVGGFNGANQNGMSIYVRSNNFADVTNAVLGGTEARAAGFIGGTNQNARFISCANYGDITNLSTAATTQNQAGGFVGHDYGTNPWGFYNCTNFGDIQVTLSTAQKGSFLAFKTSANTQAITLIGCANFDKSTKALANASTLVRENCVNSALITTVDKAAVRLVGDQAGLRFRAQVSDLAMQKLEQADIDVVYGMLIGPKSMVGSSAYSREVGEDKFTDVSATAGEWFKGEKGNIAASAIGIPEAGYATDMTAVAYIDIKVQGTTVATLYSEDVCVRSMKTVATAALEDVIYNKSGEQWTDSIGGPILNQGDYTYATGVENKYGTQYSCYSPTERALLNKYAGN